MLAGEERASGNALGPALFFTSLILFWGLSGRNATPTQPAGIEFGTGLEEGAPEGLAIVLAHPGTRFGRGKPFAWVARLERPAGTTRLEIMVTHVTPTGAETVLDRQPLSLADPKYNVISNSIPALALAKGHYRLKVLNGDVVLATGDFTVGSAVADPIMDKGNLYGEAEIAEIGSVLDRALAPGGACAGRAGCDVNAHRDRSDPKCRPVTDDPARDAWTTGPRGRRTSGAAPDPPTSYSSADPVAPEAARRTSLCGRAAAGQ